MGETLRADGRSGRLARIGGVPMGATRRQPTFPILLKSSEVFCKNGARVK